MNARKMGLVISVGILALVGFQQASSAQQWNDLVVPANNNLAASFTDGYGSPVSAARDSVLTQGQNENEESCESVYGKSSASFVAGEFSARYFQGSSFDPEIVDTSWKAGRVMSMLELELGVGWTSCSGCFRVTGGYMVNAWYDAVKTSDFIGAVQHNDFTGLNGKLTFDGLVARAEIRY